MFFCFFGFPEGFKQKEKRNLRENQKYQRKPQKTKKTLGKTKNNKVFKGFRPTLGYGFGLFVFVVSPNVFFNKKNEKSLGKTNNTKEDQRKPKQPSGKQIKNKFTKVSDPPLDMGLIFLLLFVFPNVCFVFFGMFGFLEGCFGFLWFSLVLLVFSKDFLVL